MIFWNELDFVVTYCRKEQNLNKALMISLFSGRIFPIFLVIMGMLACNNPPAVQEVKDQISDGNLQVKDSCKIKIRNRLLSNVDFATADSVMQYSTRFDTLVIYYLRALEQTINLEERHLITNRIGYCLFRNNEDVAAKELLKSLLSRSTSSDSLVCKDLVAETQIILGQCYYWIGRFPPGNLEFPAFYYADSALLFLNLALEYYQMHHENNEISLSNSHRFLGEVYRVLQKNYLRAEGHYVKAQKFALTSPLISSGTKLANLYCLTSINREKEDFAKAEVYGKMLLELADSVDNVQFKSLAYSCLGNIHVELNQFEPARTNIDSAIAINLQAGNRKSNLTVFYNNQIVVLTELDELKLAIELSDQVIDMLIENQESDNLSTAYFHRGSIFEMQGKGSEALEFYHKSLKLRIKNHGRRHKDVAAVYEIIGKYYLKNQELDSALIYFQNSLIAGSENFSISDYRENPNLQNIIGNKDLINVLMNKSDALRSKYSLGIGNQDDLETSLSCLQLCDSLIDQSWKSFLAEESKLFLAGRVFPIYEKAIDVVFEQYNCSKNKEKVSEAFQFFEKNRYRYLIDNLENEFAYEIANVSDSLVQALADTEYKLNYLKQEQAHDPHNRAIFDQEIYRSTAGKERLVMQLQDEYPDFFKAKSGADSFEWNKVISLFTDQQTCLIEYFYGHDHIYILAANGLHQSFSRVKRSKEIDSAVETIVNISSDPDPKRLMDSVILQNYFESSVFVYNTLLKEPLENFSNSTINSIVIIPDGELSKLSFEALITSPSNGNAIDPTELSYLIHKYVVSYGFSAKMLIATKEHESRKKNRVLGFGYGSLWTPELDYSPLSGSSQEIKSISRLFQGQFYRNQKATESNFKRKVSDYGILHLALHGEVDVEKDDSTMLVFRKSELNHEDGFLMPFELYNLDLNARLVVLSSCQSGLGKTYQGEGVYSMARAFAYKGCPTLVSTLWPVHDGASAAIMLDFYRELAKGNKINEALRLAKLNHLEKAESYLAHPAIWASYVPVGEMDMIRIKRNRSIIFVLVTISLLLISLRLIVRRRSKY